MAATCTISVVDIQSRAQPIRKYTFAWVSHTDGTVSAVPVLASNKKVAGRVLRVVFDPNSGGNAPTDNYDVTLLDENGVDVLMGLGANRDTANSEQVIPAVLAQTGVAADVANGITPNMVVPLVLDNYLQPSITNAGSGKSGSIIVYTVPPGFGI